MIESKYHARKVTVDGITFDSKAEALRYQELRLMQRAGEISDLKCQVPFELQPKFKKNGKTIRSIKYYADFTYTDLRTGQRVVEDVKGMRTDAYLIKRKMFDYRYQDLTITEIEAKRR